MNNTITLTDLNTLMNECKKELIDLGYYEVMNKSYMICFNSRFKAKLGQIKLIPGGYQIDINSHFAEICPEGVRNTIMHELIHSLQGCMNHGNKWQTIAKLVNNTLHYNVTTTSYYEKYQKYYNAHSNKSTTKYTLTCATCNHKWNYKKRTKLITKIQNNQAYVVMCPYCGGAEFHLTNL